VSFAATSGFSRTGDAASRAQYVALLRMAAPRPRREVFAPEAGGGCTKHRVSTADPCTQLIGGNQWLARTSPIAPRKHPQRANRTQAGAYATFLPDCRAISQSHPGTYRRAPGVTTRRR
jgi:hypothetical protein